MESDLRQALTEAQFRLLYQPVIDLKSNKLAGFEALLRWDHPRDRGHLAEHLHTDRREHRLVQDAEMVAQRLAELRALGVRLAIDDFGTGYSSLSYLRQFPIDILKIDRSFTQTISDESPMPAIVRGLLDLARTLGMETVAKGIELEVQHNSLRDGQCGFGQGLLFGAPLGVPDATALIDTLSRELALAGPR